jgi:hypothetical protein
MVKGKFQTIYGFSLCPIEISVLTIVFGGDVDDSKFFNPGYSGVCAVYCDRSFYSYRRGRVRSDIYNHGQRKRREREPV